MAETITSVGSQGFMTALEWGVLTDPFVTDWVIFPDQTLLLGVHVGCYRTNEVSRSVTYYAWIVAVQMVTQSLIDVLPEAIPQVSRESTWHQSHLPCHQ